MSGVKHLRAARRKDQITDSGAVLSLVAVREQAPLGGGCDGDLMRWMVLPVWQHDGMQSEVVKGVSGAVRTLTTRLPASEARRAELVARAESISVNELTRRALTAYSDNRCANEEFLAHARALVEQDAALIDGSR